MLIICVVWSVWFFNTGLKQIIELVSTHSVIMLTMLFGSFVAGSTSLGGGAVAFPVFTKVLSIPADIALVFSLAIQSVGMTAAMIILIVSKAAINQRIILGSVLPGAFGLYCSLFLINDWIVGSQIKLLFSLFSLCVAFMLIYEKQRDAKALASSDQTLEKPLPATLIMVGGFIGGLLSGLIGTGIDFVLFAFMMLFSSMGLKQAIATSVCVMAINAVIGFAMIYILSNSFSGIVVEYWLAAIPIVVVGAPLGALACRYFHRDIIFYLLMSLIVLDVTSTALILGQQSPWFIVVTLLMIAAFISFFNGYKNSHS